MPETRGQSAKRRTNKAADEHDGHPPAKKITGPTKQASAHSQATKGADASSTSSFTITHLIGDLTIDPPKNAVLIHSVNCAGEWGSGVALALAKKFPAAFKVYQEECQKSPEALLGTCSLIRPQDGKEAECHWIACLFVSESYGRKTKTKPGKAKPADITKYTKTALEDLRRELETYQLPGNDTAPDVNELWACKFNSGSFGVKWETTVKVIEGVFRGWEGQITVVSYE